MLDLCIVGGLGRMGRIMASLVEADPDLRIVSVWETHDAIERGGDFCRATGYSRNPVTLTAIGEEAVASCDVVVDFSLPQAFRDVVRVCDAFSRPLVTGTTGIDDKQIMLAPLARKVAVVSSPNMAIGINAVFRLCEVMAKQIGKISDIEIIETHHRTKKDAPSGTALEMARILGSITGKEPPIHSLRLGEVPGRHTVVFSLRGETLEVTHNAQSRECFAAGALSAARFVVKARTGLYTMLDVVGSD